MHPYQVLDKTCLNELLNRSGKIRTFFKFDRHQSLVPKWMPGVYNNNLRHSHVTKWCDTSSAPHRILGSENPFAVTPVTQFVGTFTNSPFYYQYRKNVLRVCWLHKTINDGWVTFSSTLLILWKICQEHINPVACRTQSAGLFLERSNFYFTRYRWG